jgi:hypothetical protein
MLICSRNELQATRNLTPWLRSTVASALVQVSGFQSPYVAWPALILDSDMTTVAEIKVRPTGGRKT